MNSQNKAVLVGVDGTDASYKAVWWAANYADHAGFDLHIVCVYSLPDYAAASFDAANAATNGDATAHTDAQAILTKAKSIAAAQGVDAQTLVMTGDPVTVFTELSHNYHLIVIGNRTKAGLAGRMLGTTSSSLPAMAYCPIVVVPYTDDNDKQLYLENKITKVVVGSDESKWGLSALNIAAEFADSWGASLTVLSAVPIYAASSGIFSLTLSEEDTERVFDSYLDDLRTRVAPIRKAYPNLVLDLKVVGGSAVDALIKASVTHNIVVVGSRGRGGFTGLLFGSTSQSLIQHAEAPVYVVPRKYVETVQATEDMRLAPIPFPEDIPSTPLADVEGIRRVDVTGGHDGSDAQ